MIDSVLINIELLYLLEQLRGSQQKLSIRRPRSFVRSSFLYLHQLISLILLISNTLYDQIVFYNIALYKVIDSILSIDTSKISSIDSLPNSLQYKLIKLLVVLTILTTLFNIYIYISYNLYYFQESIIVVLRKIDNRDYEIARLY